MSTISTTVINGLTLGPGGYASPLTILPTGYVSYDGPAYAITGTGTLINQGTIAQNDETTGAVSLTGTSFINNAGRITGNAGYAVVLNGPGGISDGPTGFISSFYGVQLLGAGDTLTNLGSIVTTGGIGNAVDLAEGGRIINGSPTAGASTALLLGNGGILVGADKAGTITNYGTIAGQPDGAEGIELSGGGTITSGAGGATQALIQGYLDGIASFGSYTAVVFNSATIGATSGDQGSYGILIEGTGSITNTGAASLIQGNSGISIALNGTVSNAGTIASANYGHAGTIGVIIQANGNVANTGPAALIEGYEGGIAIGASGTITNAGTVLALDSAGYAAVSITNNGNVANLTGASLIQGYVGVTIGGVGSVTNAGTIQGLQGGVGDGHYYGVVLGDGGSVVNGANGATTALLYGSWGVYVKDSPGTVANYATILATHGYGRAVELADGGSVVNGAPNNAQASIYGASDGVIVNGAPASITNFGTIASGSVGVALNDGGTVIDAGRISGGNGGNAIYFGEGGALLVLQPGYALSGPVQAKGSYNTLELQGSSTTPLTATYASLGLINFQTIAFAPGAGAHATLVVGFYQEFAKTIAGFTGLHDRIDLTNLGDTGQDATVTFSSAGGGSTLTVTGDGIETTTLALAGPSSNYTGITWQTVYDGTGGTLVYGENGAQPVPPEITNLTPYQGIPAATTATPFTGVAITDSSPDANDTVTVALSSPAAGTLSTSGDGSFNPTTGVFSVSGSPSQVTTDIDALTFTPSGSVASTSWFGTAGFTIDVNGPGGSIAGSTNLAEVRQVLGLGAVNPQNLALSVNPVSGSFAEANDSDTNEAVVLNVASNGTYALPTGYQAEFLGGSNNATLTDTSGSGGNALLAGNAGVDTISSNAAGDTLLGAGAGSTMQFLAGASGGIAFATPDGVNMSDAGSHDTMLGSSGTTQATVSGTDGVFFGQSGATTVQASGQGDTLVGGSGSTALQFTNSATDGVMFGGFNNVTISDAGSHDTMLGSAGPTAATVTGANALFFIGSGAATVRASGAQDTLVAGGSNPTLLLSSGATDDIAFGGTTAVAITDAGSNDTMLGSSAVTSVSISGSLATFIADKGTTSVSVSGHGDTLGGGSNTTSYKFMSGAADAVAFGGSAALSVSDAGTGDTVVGSSLSTNATISGADAVFFAGDGSASISASGHGDTLVGGSGQSTVRFAVGATDGLAVGGSAPLTLSDNGTADTLAAGTGTTTVSLAGHDAEFFAGSASVAVVDSGTSDTISAGTGPLATTSSGSGLFVFGSSGSMAFTGGSHGATIVAGSGTVSITGGSGGVTVFGDANGTVHYSGSSGQLYYAAGSGNETLDASKSTTANAMFGGSGADSIIGGQGSGQANDTMSAGSGNDTLVGNTDLSSHDIFVFFRANDAGAPQDAVQNFTVNDEVLLAGYGSSAAAAALSSASTHNGSVTLTLSDDTTITFADVASVSALTGHVVSV